MSLVVEAQEDFSLGMCPGIAPHLIPRNGAARLVNYLIDEDGSPFKRSGTEVLSAAFGSAGLTFVWDGWVAAGRRTVLANPSDFGVMAASGSSVVNLGGSGLAEPARAVEVAGILFIDGGTMYAGSRKSAAYSTGTVATTDGSPVVTGSGTSWSANVDAGMILKVGAAAGVVQSVDSNTQITLTRPWSATASGQAYSLSPVTTVPSGVPTGPYAAAAQRLIAFDGNKVRFSAYGNPLSWNLDEDYHEISGGVVLKGGEALGTDSLMAFTSRGLWTIGNLSQEIVDDFGNPQQPETQAARDLELWGLTGIAGWRDTLVVPARDGVWLIGANEFALVSETVGPLYTGYVQAGYKPGLAAVVDSHYLLPVLDSVGEVEDLLVCRLDRPIRARGRRMWGWTVWRGAGAEVSALAVRDASDGDPMLIGAEAGAGSRLLEFGPFTHDGNPTDHDGSAVVPDMVLRDWATGPLNENLVKKYEVRYELVGPGGEGAVEPSVEAWYGTDARPVEALWDEASWDVDYWPAASSDDDGFVALPGDGSISMGEQPHRWTVGKKVRFIRPRFKVDGAARRFVVRHVRVFVRPSGRV